MRYTALIFVALATIGEARYYSYSSSSSSSSTMVTNEDGKEHSESTSEESYAENDSTGLDRKGEGKIVEKDGSQVFEKTENCQNGKCISSLDTRLRRIRRAA